MCIRNSGHPKDQRKTKSQQVLLQNPSYLRFLQPLPKEFFIVNNGFKREKGQLLVTVKDYFLFFLTFINEQKKKSFTQ